jgi:hypothetical protein
MRYNRVPRQKGDKETKRWRNYAYIIIQYYYFLGKIISVIQKRSVRLGGNVAYILYGHVKKCTQNFGIKFWSYQIILKIFAR